MAGKAVEVAGEPAKEAVAGLVRKVREKFRGRPADEAILGAAAGEPGSAERLAELREALRRSMAEDPAFRDEVQALWGRARLDASAEGDGVVNIFQGRAEKSIQLRDVHGGLTIN
ncbi:hypothetical protein [Streptosporangium sp. KLBMP 9127]|nr:hypothetical protein [Streptosporangium sp. KLBMP 9127]